MKSYQVLVFIFLCLLVLLGISFLVPEDLEESTFKYPTSEQLFFPKRVEKRQLEEVAKFRADSIAYALKRADSLSFEDTLAIYESFDNDNPARLHYPANNKRAFYPFFRYLDSIQKKDTAAHVLHYGDSQIEMDRITGYLREQFQNMFGGNGVGFVTPRPLAPTYTISQHHSSNWRRRVPFGPLSMRASHYRYGPLMAVSSLDSGSNGFVRIRARKSAGTHAKKFDRLRLIYRGKVYANASGSKGKSTISEQSYPRLLNVKTWDFDTFQTVANFNITGDSASEIYGMSAESKRGVYFNNVPMRGASGTFFRSVDSTILHHSLEAMNVRMIILEFGGNVMPVIHSEKKAIWYGKKMAAQIRRLKNMRPEATILFIGPADMTKYYAGQPKTHKYLPSVIRELKMNVLKEGAIYWDMFEAMGGENSMQVWHDHKPQLASSDGIHFTKRGARKIAQMLWETILNDYRIYQMKERIAALNEE